MGLVANVCTTVAGSCYGVPYLLLLGDLVAFGHAKPRRASLIPESAAEALARAAPPRAVLLRSLVLPVHLILLAAGRRHFYTSPHDAQNLPASARAIMYISLFVGIITHIIAWSTFNGWRHGEDQIAVLFVLASALVLPTLDELHAMSLTTALPALPGRTASAASLLPLTVGIQSLLLYRQRDFKLNLRYTNITLIPSLVVTIDVLFIVWILTTLLIQHSPITRGYRRPVSVQKRSSWWSGIRALPCDHAGHNPFTMHKCAACDSRQSGLLVSEYCVLTLFYASTLFIVQLTLTDYDFIVATPALQKLKLTTIALIWVPHYLWGFQTQLTDAGLLNTRVFSFWMLLIATTLCRVFALDRVNLHASPVTKRRSPTASTSKVFAQFSTP